MRLSADEIADIIDLGIEIAVDRWKHGTTTTYLFGRDGQHYTVTACFHSSEGLQDWGEAQKVSPRIVTMTEWVDAAGTVHGKTPGACQRIPGVEHE